jgi:hypothetical protein
MNTNLNEINQGLSQMNQDHRAIPIEIEHMMVDGLTPLKDCASVSQALFGNFLVDTQDISA